MKREGNIHTVEDIEQLIKSTNDYRLVRNGAKPDRNISNSESRVFSKVYEVYSGPFIFVIRLEFDYRIARGRVAWQYKENTLFQAVPGLRPKLLSLYPVTSGWKKEVMSRKYVESASPDIPYEIRKMADETNPDNDRASQEIALEGLVEIRDFINAVMEKEQNNGNTR